MARYSMIGVDREICLADEYLRSYQSEIWLTLHPESGIRGLRLRQNEGVNDWLAVIFVRLFSNLHPSNLPVDRGIQDQVD